MNTFKYKTVFLSIMLAVFLLFPTRITHETSGLELGFGTSWVPFGGIILLISAIFDSIETAPVGFYFTPSSATIPASEDYYEVPLLLLNLFISFFCARFLTFIFAWKHQNNGTNLLWSRVYAKKLAKASAITLLLVVMILMIRSTILEEQSAIGLFTLVVLPLIALAIYIFRESKLFTMPQKLLFYLESIFTTLAIIGLIIATLFALLIND